MRRPSRLCALGASAIRFQPLTPHWRGVYRGSRAAVFAARFNGHGVGDRVLIALVAAMRRGLRMGDLLARLGGEEFALMLPETDAATAHQIGQRLLDEVRRLRLPGLERLRCTVSLGVASLSPEDRDGDALLQRADQALYRAKQAGRDQVLS